MKTPAHAHAVSFEPSGLPGDDPRPLLELVDDYLGRLADYRQASDKGASPGRLAAIARQHGLARLGGAIAARVGPGGALVRSGWCLLPAGRGPDGGGSLAACPIVADLDDQAALAEDLRYEAEVLALSGRLAAREGLDDQRRLFLAGALCFCTDAELSEATRALEFLPGRFPPRDMIEFAGLAAELLRRARREPGPRPDPEAALAGALLDALDRPAPPGDAESPGPIGPDYDPLHPPTEARERIE